MLTRSATQKALKGSAKEVLLGREKEKEEAKVKKPKIPAKNLIGKHKKGERKAFKPEKGLKNSIETSKKRKLGVEHLKEAIREVNSSSVSFPEDPATDAKFSSKIMVNKYSDFEYFDGPEAPKDERESYRALSKGKRSKLTDDGIPIESVAPTRCEFSGFRKQRDLWTEEEIDALTEGVQAYGPGNWALILQDHRFGSILRRRDKFSLKDKWRNLANYLPRGQRAMRRYVVVDEFHREITSDAGNIHILNNRWPREAALKVATHPEFFGLPILNEGDFVVIRLKEMKRSNDNQGNYYQNIVHVYKGRKIAVPAPDIPKFEHQDYAWEAEVSKMKEEFLMPLNK